ncbi:MAG: hypothetical protein CVU20_15930 [Betaproteobacteria bacterium HGW-Betaproteobacteria-14]|jgi:hypothetical protein|nr:MAG: hypothetical protein CVU20_15930 [Betaproteobacteria bacterium HGW-Betaproteobacteria-14]
MELKNAYRRKLAAQLKEWGAQINLLEAKVENAGADARIKGAMELDNLRAKQRAASAKMKEMEKASSEAWGQLKETADTIWADLKAGVADAQARFK